MHYYPGQKSPRNRYYLKGDDIRHIHWLKSHVELSFHLECIMHLRRFDASDSIHTCQYIITSRSWAKRFFT